MWTVGSGGRLWSLCTGICSGLASGPWPNFCFELWFLGVSSGACHDSLDSGPLSVGQFSEILMEGRGSEHLVPLLWSLKLSLRDHDSRILFWVPAIRMNFKLHLKLRYLPFGYSRLCYECWPVSQAMRNLCPRSGGLKAYRLVLGLKLLFHEVAAQDYEVRFLQESSCQTRNIGKFFTL